MIVVKVGWIKIKVDKYFSAATDQQKREMIKPFQFASGYRIHTPTHSTGQIMASDLHSNDM
jgi:P2-related tail formation protein